MRINFAGRSDLFEGAVAEQRDAIGESHSFFLIVGDKQESDSDLTLK